MVDFDDSVSFLLEDVIKQIEDKSINYEQKIALFKNKDDLFHKATLNYILWKKEKDIKFAEKSLSLFEKCISYSLKNELFWLVNYSIEMLFRILKETNQKIDVVLSWIHKVFSIFFKYEVKRNSGQNTKMIKILIDALHKFDNLEEFSKETKKLEIQNW